MVTPKFKIGDVVYKATTESTPNNVQCPDCLGSGRWAVKSPAGYESTTECPRCQGRKVLTQPGRAGRVTTLTIGHVRTEEPPPAGEAGITYMARETGLGTGTLHPEESLYTSEGDAKTAAAVLARVKTAEEEARNPKIAEVRGLYALRWNDAEVKRAVDQRDAAIVRLNLLCDRIIEMGEHPFPYGRYADSTGLSSRSITTAQRDAIQEYLVCHDEDLCDRLDEFREEKS